MKAEKPPVACYESVRVVFEGSGPVRVLSTEVSYRSEQESTVQLKTGPETWKMLTPSRLALLLLLVRHRRLLAVHTKGIDPELELLRGPRPSVASRLKDNLFDKGRQWVREAFGTLGGLRADTPGLVRLYRMTEEGGQHVVRLLSDGRFSLRPEKLEIVWNDGLCTGVDELLALEQSIERQAGVEDSAEERNGTDDAGAALPDGGTADSGPPEGDPDGQDTASATPRADTGEPSPAQAAPSAAPPAAQAAPATGSSGAILENSAARASRWRWARRAGFAAAALAVLGLAVQGLRGRSAIALRSETGAVLIGLETTPGDRHAVHRISSPGVYLLAGPLAGEPNKVGILVDADDVTLDLGGHTLSGGPQSLSGIAGGPVPRRRLAIRRGTVTGWGKAGLELPNVAEVSVEDVNAASNGAAGIQLGSQARASRCRASDNVGNGLELADEGVVDDCEARGNAFGFQIGRLSQVRHSLSSANNMDGFVVGADSAVEGCIACRNFGSGFQTAFGTVVRCVSTDNGLMGFTCERTRVEGCTAQRNGMDGFRGSTGCTFTGNSTRENTKAGIQVLAGLNCIQNNHVSQNARGIEVTQGPDSRGNVVTGNIVMMNRDDDVDVDTPENNAIGPVVSIQQEKATPLDAPPWANFRWEPTPKAAQNVESK